jgi:hypothetical protein
MQPVFLHFEFSLHNEQILRQEMQLNSDFHINFLEECTAENLHVKPLQRNGNPSSLYEKCASKH